MNLYGKTEAMEGTASITQALENLACQVKKGETMGVIAQYQAAAYWAGASYDDVQATEYQARNT